MGVPGDLHHSGGRQLSVPALADQLETRQVAVHDWLVGELARGNLRNRHEVLTLLQNLTNAIMATDQVPGNGIALPTTGVQQPVR